ESKARNVQETTPLYQLATGVKRNFTFNCDYGIAEKIRLKSRIQYSRYFFDRKTSRGFTIVQDASISVGRFRFTGRQALFDTDDFDNRQYNYENDAWLAYSFPSYSGCGVRNYALIEYKISKNLTVWARYARTRLLNEEEISGGHDAIEGNTRNDVKFQARFTF
ncbi:MAG TPA: helix-hairpin-helix domain-containing protein, partial [Chryseosolibacter sp.]